MLRDVVNWMAFISLQCLCIGPGGKKTNLKRAVLGGCLRSFLQIPKRDGFHLLLPLRRGDPLSLSLATRRS